MALTVLSVAYPLAAAGPDAVGGAEQILSRLDVALVRAGHHSIVVACEGSQAAQTLVAVPHREGVLDEGAVALAREHHRAAVMTALERWPVDLVHMHGVDFLAYLPPAGVPVLVTLHLPIGWYPPEMLEARRPDTWFNCVSAEQHASCPAMAHLLPPIENGVPLPPCSRGPRKDFALMLTRICPEKGVHVGIEACKRAGVPLLVAGQVFPYEEHRRYFEQEVLPRLDRSRRFIGPVGGTRKQTLLAAARCLLIPSLVDETSSLAAGEALAAGTPVVAFAKGALANTIRHGETGFLAHDRDGMAAAISAAGRIEPDACRRVAREHYSLERMIERYFDVYRRLAQHGRQPFAA